MVGRGTVHHYTNCSKGMNQLLYATDRYQEWKNESGEGVHKWGGLHRGTKPSGQSRILQEVWKANGSSSETSTSSALATINKNLDSVHQNFFEYDHKFLQINELTSLLIIISAVDWRRSGDNMYTNSSSDTLYSSILNAKYTHDKLRETDHNNVSS